MEMDEGQPPPALQQPAGTADGMTLQELPHELLCQILGRVQLHDWEFVDDSEDGVTHLDPRCKHSLLPLRRVSRAFRAAADESVRSLYFQVHVFGVDTACYLEHQFPITCFLHRVLPLWRNLRKVFLSLKCSRPYLAHTLETTATSCPLLEELRLDARDSTPSHADEHSIEPFLSTLAPLQHLTTLKLYGFDSFPSWWLGLSSLPALKNVELVDVGFWDLDLPPQLESFAVWQNFRETSAPCLLRCSQAGSLRELHLVSLYSVESLPLPPSLEVLRLHNVEVTASASMDVRLPRLASLEITNTYLSSIRWLHNCALSDMTALTALTLRAIQRAQFFPDFQHLPALRSLVIQDCLDFTALPPLPPHLHSLELEECPLLDSLAGLATAHNLEVLSIDGCDSLSHCTEIGGLGELKSLIISDVRLQELPDLTLLVHLRTLRLSSLELVRQLQLPSSLISLEHVTVGKLSRVASIRNFSTSTMLKSLHADNCPFLQEPDLREFPSLEKLSFKNVGWSHLPDMSHVTGLRELTISAMPELLNFPSLDQLQMLESLWVDKCKQLKSVWLPPLPMLQKLSVTSCPAIDDIDLGVNGQLRLEELTFIRCYALEALQVHHLPSLRKLAIHVCPQLKSLPGLQDLPQTLELWCSENYSIIDELGPHPTSES